MKDTLAKGTTGILATGGGVAVSLSGLNEILQCVSLVIGIAVGIASLIAIVRKQKTKYKKNEH